MTYAELAAVFRLVAGQIDNLGAVPQPSEPTPAPPPPAPDPPKPDPPPPPPPPAAPAPPKPVIDLDTVKGVQQALNQIRAANFPKLEENGVHDALMIWDLKYFQASTGIPVTGEIDKITIDTLHKAIFGTPRT
jgi:hypothetical protein